MMRGQASDNILTLMASIDRLHSQATRSDLWQAQNQKTASQTPTTPVEAAVAATGDNEVVHLNAQFASLAHGQSQPTGQLTDQGQRQGRQKPVSSRRRPANTSKDNNDDFDAKLAKLIEDVVGTDSAGEQDIFENSEAAASPQRTERQTGQRKTPYLDHAKTENTRDIRSEIDFLLAPYLEKTGAATLSGSPADQRPKNRPENLPENRPEYLSAKTESIIRQIASKPVHKELNPKPEMQQDTAPSSAIGNETLNALLTPADLLELNDFIMQEIKKHISVWITQNIDKIIEDSLLSARSEARNATDSARETGNRSG